MAVSWLLLLLGTAIGVGIADATDLAAMNAGLGFGSIVWLLLTSLVATFCGAALAGKLSFSPDDRIGAIHGLVLWSVATVATVVLSATSFGAAVNGVASVLSNSASTTRAIAVQIAGAGSEWDVPEELQSTLAATLRRQMSRRLADLADYETSPAELRGAMRELTSDDLAAISSSLLSGNTEQAKQRLANRTRLESEDIHSIIAGIESRVKQAGNSPTANQIQQWLTRQLNEFEASLARRVSSLVGPEVSTRTLKTAIDDLDAGALEKIGRRLANGNIEGAKDALTAETALSQDDVDAIVDGAQAEARELIDTVRTEVNQVTETVGTYAQATLWTAFVAAALGAIAGLFGGYIGAGTVRRLLHVTVVTR